MVQSEGKVLVRVCWTRDPQLLHASHSLHSLRGHDTRHPFVEQQQIRFIEGLAPSHMLFFPPNAHDPPKNAISGNAGENSVI